MVDTSAREQSCQWTRLPRCADESASPLSCCCRENTFEEELKSQSIEDSSSIRISSSSSAAAVAAGTARSDVTTCARNRVLTRLFSVPVSACPLRPLPLSTLLTVSAPADSPLSPLILPLRSAVEIPASILQLKSVSREMNFSSREEISNFRLVQSVSLHGQPLEEWRFTFGFVIPDSTNSWQCLIESAGEAAMIPASVLSGNIVIETHFYDGETEVSTTRIRVYYV